MPERNGATEATRSNQSMKTLNRPTRSKPPLPAPVVKPALPAKTIEQMQAQQHDRMIRRAAERLERSRKLHLEWKAKKAQKTQPLAIAPKLSLPKVQPAVVASSATIPAPAFSQETQSKFGLAVKALKIKGRSLHQRLLICHHHLQADPALSEIDPQLLLKELQNK
jgi:hypothetical protein